MLDIANQPKIQGHSSSDIDGLSNTTPVGDNQAKNLKGEEPPSAESQAKAASYTVLDRQEKPRPYHDLYNGLDAAPRTLVVFIRHFFCGSCKEYVRSLSEVITPELLSDLSTPTSVVIVGCGDPGLIEAYATETDCRFPIYADPTRKLYDELGLLSSLAMSARPDYIRKGMTQVVVESVWEKLKQIPSGLALKGGDSRQNGGEFLYDQESGREEKRANWCHRMSNTRDHTELAVLIEILKR
ncbi:peroxiredoxin-like family protein [Aspergillus homomorphus CBS 101889]|uniref:AhpC/TSA antioxidant enzyme-domain-containing protein n=1 Tax=Aspergillus homomorphus (strain CBS 101889) TaxID=1450537 RepID=A0A395I1W1_ASPHC|nr:hypothetical protein BO97DRAFT_476898 [Aspergillus homomorphus CBS 101889]RAL14182.1 hypothetical protein BO97DRAFT_476898 [Aspergillus homomorphus CBS 101889]